MTIIQLTNPDQKSIEQCIREAYERFGVKPLGGASEDGWSKMNDFQRCPYRYWLMHEPHVIDNDISTVGDTASYLGLGALYHAALACKYMRAIDSEYPTAFAVLAAVREFGGDASIVDECTRLIQAYEMHYGADSALSPLAIELPAGKPEIHTCRLDMLAQVNGATWIVEHKTASREDRTVLESWWLDGEILGEVYGYKLSGLEALYGPLTGVLINICIKTKEPKFRRVEVVVTDQLLNDYARDLQFWRGIRQAMRLGNIWPRKLNGCIGRYDTCTFWDHCRDAASTDDARLNRLLQLSLRK